MKNINEEFETVKPYLDKDIIDRFEEIVEGSYGKEKYPRNYVVTASALVATNIQLIRCLKEAFSRGFIVKEINGKE